MKILKGFKLVILSSILFITNLNAEVIYVISQQEFDQAQDSAEMNDSIVWRTGRYSDIFMEVEKDHLTIMAEDLGKTIFTGGSRVDLKGDHIHFEGFQFLDGSIGTRDVINIRGSYIEFTQVNIRAYTCYKYLRVREESQYVTISYCNFENRLNQDDQNILSILVDDINPGYHKVQYCSFKNFDGIGDDQGIEPIRIGVSTQADFISRSLVEYCYFTQCNGDGEIISSKATENVYRYNTFENNPKAELVLRHGSKAIVYGNFFLNGKGGVRVREGQDHYIYNNYFYNLDDRAIYLQNESSDPLDNINIAFNTVTDCSEIILGGSGNFKPTNVTLANNIFSDPDDDIFEQATTTETWIGNIAFGDLGIAIPTNGLLIMDPQLDENSEGYFGLNANSPAINAAQSGYKILPQFEGVESVDTELLFDLMGQNRPSSIEEKDLGCNEFPHIELIQPIATENNTGPIYNTSGTTSNQNIPHIVNDLIKVFPNPVKNNLTVDISSTFKAHIRIDILNVEGQTIKTIFEDHGFLHNLSITKNVEFLPSGMYTLRASSTAFEEGKKSLQLVKFIKVKS